MMFVLAGHQTRLALSMTFAAWAQAVIDGRGERSVAETKEEMTEQAEQHKNRHDETKRKYFMLMDDSRKNLLIGNVFPVWAKLVSELKKDKQHERQVMLMLFGHESRLVLTETVGAWVRLAKQSRQKLQHERKMMFLLAGHQTRLSSSMTFAAWVQVCKDGDRARLKNRHDETRRKYFMLMDDSR